MVHRNTVTLLLSLMSLVYYHQIRTAVINESCPETCNCSQSGYTKCSSYEALMKRLHVNQNYNIKFLNLRNITIMQAKPIKIDVSTLLKTLDQLESLDLSHNAYIQLPVHYPILNKLESLNLSNTGLKALKFSHLPSTLEHLDVSHNLIERIPHDWRKLQHLKTINLTDNPMNCDCDMLNVYNNLLKNKNGIHVIGNESLFCHHPTVFYGIPLGLMNCSIFDDYVWNAMMGDESGSGSSISTENYDYEESSAPLVDEHDEYDTSNESTTTVGNLNDIEGSGFDGHSDEFILPKSCHINCSTPRPIGIHDERNASPMPSLREQISIIFGDIFGTYEQTKATPIIMSETTTTVSTISTTAKSVVKKKSGINEASSIFTTLASEEKTLPTSITVTASKPNLAHDRVKLFVSDQSSANEIEAANFYTSPSSIGVFVIGLMVVLLICLLIYYVVRNKKRSKPSLKTHRRMAANKNYDNKGEELKPLAVKMIPATAVTETSVLIHQNPSSILSNTNGCAYDIENGISDVSDVRRAAVGQLNEPERVTIRVSELPDSVPKTPLYVQRQIVKLADTTNSK